MGNDLKFSGSVAAAGLLVCAILVGFLQPITPDSSVYLLQARTFLEEGTRYLAAHDSKGPLLTWLIAPAVWLMGANALAAGAIRASAALITSVCLYHVIVTHGRQRHWAFQVACLAGALPYSMLVWGDSLRPETFAIPITSLIFLIAMRSIPRTAWIAGALTVSLGFLKTIIVIPALGICAAWIGSHLLTDKGNSLRIATGLCLGALCMAALVLGVVATTDSLPEWYQQTIQWPASFRQNAESTDFPSLIQEPLGFALTLYKASDDPRRPWLMPLKIPASLLISGTLPLALLAFGLRMHQRGKPPVTPLPAPAWGWLIGMLLLLALEYRRWMYPTAGLTTPLLLMIAWAGPSAQVHTRRIVGLWLCSSLLIGGLLVQAARILPARLRGEPLSPYEMLARDMSEHYKAGDTLLVLDNNYALHLLLSAPPPQHPILPLHSAMVSENEQRDLINTLKATPPVWIASKQPAYSGILWEHERPTVEIQRSESEDLQFSGPYPVVIETTEYWARRISPPNAP